MTVKDVVLRPARVAVTLAAVATVAAGMLTVAAAPAVAIRNDLRPSAPLRVGSSQQCTLGFVFSNERGLAVGTTSPGCGKEGAEVFSDGRQIGTIGDTVAGMSLVKITTTDMRVYANVDTIGPVVGLLPRPDVIELRPLLCYRGARTGLACGTVVDGPVNDQAAPITITAGGESADRGAPVYALTRQGGLKAVGILTGPGTERSQVTPVVPGTDEAHLQLVL